MENDNHQEHADMVAKRVWTPAMVTAVLTALPAFAQQPAAPQASRQIEEVFVTAQRRSENMQDVPVAVTAASSERALRISS